MDQRGRVTFQGPRGWGFNGDFMGILSWYLQRISHLVEPCSRSFTFRHLHSFFTYSGYFHDSLLEYPCVDIQWIPEIQLQVGRHLPGLFSIRSTALPGSTSSPTASSSTSSCQAWWRANHHLTLGGITIRGLESRWKNDWTSGWTVYCFDGNAPGKTHHFMANTIMVVLQVFPETIPMIDWNSLTWLFSSATEGFAAISLIQSATFACKGLLVSASPTCLYKS